MSMLPLAVAALLSTAQLALGFYDPFGCIPSQRAPMVDADVYRFSSRQLHAESSLSYYLPRFYEPGTQRWLNRDPIQEVGGINLYTFIGNKPTNNQDPLGLTYLVSPTPFPGQEGTFGPYVLYINDGSDLVKTPRNLDPKELFKNEVRTCKRLQEKSALDALILRDEANFDTRYFRGLSADNRQYYWYNGKIYGDNEINYFGIGMYENWAGDSQILAEAITYAWKLSKYHETPTENTLYWLKKGYSDYSAFNDPSKPLPK
jgi:RHS repeat-associated protein